MRLTSLLLAAALLGACMRLAAAQPTGVPGERELRQQELVDRATLTAQDILGWRQDDEGQRLLPYAKAVMICPSIFRMSFLFGGSGGGCVLLARDAAGSWSAPAFYSMGSGSFGLQAGIQDAEIMLFILTRKGLIAILDSQFKIGGDASLAFATLGLGVEGSTTAALRADIVAVEKTKGLFAGIALQGSIMSSDSAGDRAYYGQPVGAEDIVVAMRVNNPGADPLRAALIRFSAPAAPPAPYRQPTYSRQPAYPPPSYPPGGGYGAPPADAGPIQLAPTSPVQQQPLPPPR